MSFIDGIRGIFCVNRTIKIRFKFKTFKELCLSITTFEITIFAAIVLCNPSLRELACDLSETCLQISAAEQTAFVVTSAHNVLHNVLKYNVFRLNVNGIYSKLTACLLI